jgi:branched-chain amino acid transport system permease protein
MEFLGKIIISGLMNGAIYGLVAIGFVLIYKASSVLNFSQGYMLLLGGYIFWLFRGSLRLDLISSLLIALPLGFLMGVLIERLTLRPLIGQPLVSIITVTIFLSLVLEGLVSLIWGTYPLQQIPPFFRGSLKLGNFKLAKEALFAFGLALGSTLALVFLFRYTRLGLAMRGVAEGHQIMQSMGISVKRILTICWGIAGIAATLGGILLGSTLGFQLGLSYIGLLAIPAAFIGGLDSPEGAIVGGLLIGLIESFASGYFGKAAGVPTSYVVLILVMLFRPYGFFGLRGIERI